VANARRASFRRYRSTSFPRKVAQQSRTKFQNSRSANSNRYQPILQDVDPQNECSRRRLTVQVTAYLLETTSTEIGPSVVVRPFSVIRIAMAAVR
jgi:hypothetical protein